MEWPEVAGKWPEIMNFLVVHSGRRRRFAGSIPTCPAAVRREIPHARSSGCGSPSRPVVPRLVQSLTACK